MGIGDIKLKVGTKIAEVAGKDFAEEAAKGKFGSVVQTCYEKTKNHGTTISLALFLVSQALGFYTPPNYDVTMRYVDIITGVLTAVFTLDKLRRKEPIFEPALLEALAAWSLWLGSVSGTVLAFASSGTLDLIFPKHPGLADQVTLLTTALVTATAFVNRAAKASALQPKPAAEAAPTEGNPKP